MKKPTIQDVARASGVSTSSVSNYLNNRHNHLRQETIERIQQSIAELNYAPSAVARQLKSGQSSMLGLLMPSIANPYYAELALSLDAAARESGFRLLIGNVHRDAERERAFLDELAASGVRGIIVTSELKNPALIPEYVRRGIAFVFFDLNASESLVNGVDLVCIDNTQAISIAVEHLYALGHRKIAYVTSKLVTAGRLMRAEGYTQAIKRLGLGEPLIIHEDPNVTDQRADADLGDYGARAATQLLQMPDRPTAVIAMNDILAIGLFSGLSRLGVKVPQDMSIVGIDDIQFARLMVPALSSLRPDYAAMAAQAIVSLQSRLKQQDLPNREYIFTPQMVARESSLAPRSS